MEEEAAPAKRDDGHDNIVAFRRTHNGTPDSSEGEGAWLDAKFHHVTAEVLGAAMGEAKFLLTMASGRDLPWLAMAVRRSLAISAIGEMETPREQRSNAEIRDNLKSLADQTMELYRALWSLPPDDAGAIDDLLFTDEGGASPFNIEREGLLGLYNTLSRASASVAANRQGPRWRDAEERRQRIELGRHLAPVFEAAFRQAPTASDHEHGTVRKPSDFVAFYELISKLAAVPGRANDLASVTKAALQKHRSDPVRFEHGVIPGL